MRTCWRFPLSSIKQYYDEKYDRGNFIKNVILDNILPGDIYLKARELRFGSDVEPCLYAGEDYQQERMFPLTMWCRTCSRIRTRILSSISTKLISP